MSDSSQEPQPDRRCQNDGDGLLVLVYDNLRRIAAAKLALEAPGQTLQATALVHEAWLRLKNSPEPQWEGKEHFFNVAAEAMRRILIENARRKLRRKHGGGLQRVDVDEIELPVTLPDNELLALDEALKKLEVEDARAASLVKLCFFVGLTQAQAAEQLGISVATAERTWSFARVWLFQEVQRDLQQNISASGGSR